jgi:regulator of ribonuclease activity A
MKISFTTADLCDVHHGKSDYFQIVEPLFKAYGGQMSFCGQITTLKTFEDNVLIKKVLEEKVQDRVLVIDGGGSHRCALLDYELANSAVANGWLGIVIYGCIRQSEKLAALPIGVRALHAHPLQSHKRDHGDRDLSLTFAGVNFKKDHYLYADADGMIVSDIMLS